MDTRPENWETIKALLDKGVRIPNPLSLEVGADVDPARISGEGVTLHAGCRLHGARTAIAAGCTLGREAPVTIEDCRLGRDVALKGGYFKRAVFLDRSNFGSGAQVREGCLIEEEAGGAHNVGLKQTILLPFVTLGSLINFCDVLMTGGTSRKDHSEVGSSYIHFNFTPDADKATASLLGDVPRGVMLDQPRIFLGGQGGLVGPARIGFGNVVAAGGVLRGDCRDENRLILARTPRGGSVPFRAGLYPAGRRIVEANLEYVANLHALEQYYRQVRRPFFADWPLGEIVFEGALEMLALARAERIKRLGVVLERLGAAPDTGGFRAALGEQREAILARLAEPPELDRANAASRDEFVAAIAQARDAAAGAADYVATIKGLDRPIAQAGTAWLQGVVEHVTDQVFDLLPADARKG